MDYKIAVFFILAGCMIIGLSDFLWFKFDLVFVGLHLCMRSFIVGGSVIENLCTDACGIGWNLKEFLFYFSYGQ